MANDKIIVEKNKKDRYQVSFNGIILNNKFENKMTAMEYALKLGRENENTTDVVIKADR